MDADSERVTVNVLSRRRSGSGRALRRIDQTGERLFHWVFGHQVRAGKPDNGQEVQQAVNLAPGDLAVVVLPEQQKSASSNFCWLHRSGHAVYADVMKITL